MSVSSSYNVCAHFRPLRTLNELTVHPSSRLRGCTSGYVSVSSPAPVASIAMLLRMPKPQAPHMSLLRIHNICQMRMCCMLIEQHARAHRYNHACTHGYTHLHTMREPTTNLRERNGIELPSHTYRRQLNTSAQEYAWDRARSCPNSMCICF